MAFNFNWSPLAADASFYERARDLLTKALNKSPKPPIIVDDILVDEFNLGSVPPDLEILEIGDIASDRFRGIFKMCYAGDAFLTLKTRVQANPLNTYLSSKPSFTSPEPLAASSSLTIPLQITLSDIKLSAFIIVVFSKQKGLTLVFRNDPLESLKVSSTFDSIQFVRDYLQRTIEGKLRDLMMDELPAIIHRLSLQLWCPEQVPKENDPETTEEDGEVRVNPLADAPPDAVDVNGNPIDAGDISSLSATSSPEAQSLFSQKNLVRLAALTNSHRTLSLFTPGIREVVFRAWARPSDRQDSGTATGTGIGGNSSPPFSTPNMARSNSYTAAATSTNATTTTYTFSDTGSQDHGHMPTRTTMANLGAATTGLSLGSNYPRHKSYAGGRKKKTRVVNLRKTAVKNVAGSAPVSEAGDTASDSVSVQGHLSEPILPTSIPEEDEEVDDMGDHRRHALPARTAAEPNASIAATLAAVDQARYYGSDDKAADSADTAVPPIGGKNTAATATASLPFRLQTTESSDTTGGVLEAAVPIPVATTEKSSKKTKTKGEGEKKRPRIGGLPSLGAPIGTESSSVILEQAWIMKMASEIARKVYDENRKNPAFWYDRDEAPPPAYEATR